MAGVSAGLVWSSYAISSTLRPSRPPLALTSSTHMLSASSAALPPAPSEPVCGMLMPILMGPCCASASALNRSPATNDSSFMHSSLGGHCSQSGRDLCNEGGEALHVLSQPGADRVVDQLARGIEHLAGVAHIEELA